MLHFAVAVAVAVAAAAAATAAALPCRAPDCATAAAYTACCYVKMNSSQGQLIHGSEEEEEETDLMFSFPAKLYCSQQLKETKKREIFKVTCYLLAL